jgi:hypothetical protein
LPTYKDIESLELEPKMQGMVNIEQFKGSEQSLVSGE